MTTKNLDAAAVEIAKIVVSGFDRKQDFQHAYESPHELVSLETWIKFLVGSKHGQLEASEKEYIENRVQFLLCSSGWLS